MLGALGVEVLRCGARVVPAGDDERGAVRALAENAVRNDVAAALDDDGVLHVPGEHVTDPVALTNALATAAASLGARVRTGAGVDAIDGDVLHAGGEALRFAVAVNCAGVHADEVARLAGDDSFALYPRKGEFLVFDAPCADIRLPVPRAGTKGVLVFPTLDGRTVVGPTAFDGEDKDDRGVRAEARGGAARAPGGRRARASRSARGPGCGPPGATAPTTSSAPPPRARG